MGRTPSIPKSLLRRLRIRRGLQQTELAEMASSLSPSYLSEIERGLKTPSTQVINRLIQALELNPKEAEALKEELRGDQGTQTSAAVERIEQDELGQGSQVWVISRQPAELADLTYREVVLNNLVKGVRYTYWIETKQKFMELYESLAAKAPNASNLVEGIQVPPETIWFSLVIYNPLEKDSIGYQALKQEGGRVSSVRAIEPITLDRILADLRSIYRTLSSQDEPPSTIRGYEWLLSN